jgi:hypothetical protein
MEGDRFNHNHVAENNCLIVTVTSECHSRFVASSTGWPCLLIDYGGASLVLDVADLQQAETFAFELACSSLDFASQCRSLMDKPHE